MNPPPPPHLPPPPETNEGSSYVPYPKLDPNDVVPVVDTWTHTTTTTTTTMPPPESVNNNNPYVISSPLSPPQNSNNNNNKKETMKDVVGRWGKKAAEVSKKAEGLAGDMWQHLKTGPSLTDAVVGRITQGTKVLAEGGYEKLFQQTFETLPDEKLLRSCGCYLSTSAGPIVGTLYLSTLKLAFSSDNPISHKVSEVEEVQSAYYKVVILVHQLKAVNPITSKSNPAEKYIQIISADNHEFWFMGFLNYDSAVKYLQDAMQPRPM